MATDSDPRQTLLADALGQYRAEYTLLADRWKVLETKAQGTAAIAGIFVAGVFAITRDLDQSTPFYEVWLLVGVTLLLTTAILFAVRALFIRNLVDPPTGSQLEQVAMDVVRIDDDEEFAKLLPAVYSEQFSAWREANETLRQAVVAKAVAVWRGQMAVAGAVLLMTMVCLVVVLTKS
ncbi:MAG TPA: hypothetical protein VFS20_23870 [Longimicrobium sp.]|nr:hypothetical protein [Longimicrobium sp.]